MAASVWSQGEFACFSIKDCGCVPCFLPNYCGFPCIMGSALSQIKGYKEEGQCMKCGVLSCLCGFCVLCTERGEVGRHYGIPTDACGNCCCTCCCPLCVYYQLINEIMVREKLTWDCCALKPDEEKA
eukprot:m.412430 g.412430  ORF g.412430 m.412430 type:complete len:127 (+) comp28849_c0_seq1:142-522(+)